MNNNELQFDAFLRNANLNKLAQDLYILNRKLIFSKNIYKNKDNDKFSNNNELILIFDKLIDTLSMLGKIYEIKGKSLDANSKDNIDSVLTELIVAHQQLIRFQQNLSLNKDEDVKLIQILIEAGSSLSPIYPLFLVNEIITNSNQIDK